MVISREVKHAVHQQSPELLVKREIMFESLTFCPVEIHDEVAERQHFG